MNVLSLFDGMSCGQQALEKIGIKVDNYYASEIDKYAITVTMANYPNTIQLGSVVDVNGYDLPKIDFLLGGSPCQSFSFAGKRKGMSTKDEQEILTLEHYLELKAEGYEFEGQSYLFWEYMRLLNEVKPKYFILENVMMSKKWQSVLTQAIGVEPVMINSSLVSAQNRKRLYWTNIGLESNGLFGDLKSIIQQPEDKGILLKDILEDEVDEKYFLSEKIIEGFKTHKVRHDEKGTGFAFKPKESTDKGNSLRANAAICPTDNMIKVGQLGFKKEFKESEKAQTLLQRDYKGMSNHGINVVICHNLQKRDPNRPSIQKNKSAGGSGHLTRSDGKTYCLDTANSNAVEIILTSKDKRLKQTIINNELVIDEVKALDVYNQSIHNIYPTLKDPIHNDRALFDGKRIRRLTPVECERLQTVKDNYTNHVSNSQRYKMLGNGWTIDVIAHILSYINGKG
jgi:DNA (cytosine-5)-methyltransferase 1